MIFFLFCACMSKSESNGNDTHAASDSADSTTTSDSDSTTPTIDSQDSVGDSNAESTTTGDSDSGTGTDTTTTPPIGLNLWSYGTGWYTVDPGYGWVTIGAIAMCATTSGIVTMPTIEVEVYASYDPEAGEVFTLGLASNSAGDDTVSFTDRFSACSLDGIDDGADSVYATAEFVGDSLFFDVDTQMGRNVVIRDTCGGDFYDVFEIGCEVNNSRAQGGVANGYAIDVPADGGASPTSGGSPVSIDVTGFNLVSGIPTDALLVANE